MRLTAFGHLYIDTDKLVYVRRFLPEVRGPDSRGGLRLGFDQHELTLFDDEPGFAELSAWLERQDTQDQTPP